jgi:hypothetical protein
MLLLSTDYVPHQQALNKATRHCIWWCSLEISFQCPHMWYLLRQVAAWIHVRIFFRRCLSPFLTPQYREICPYVPAIYSLFLLRLCVSRSLNSSTCAHALCATPWELLKDRAGKHGQRWFILSVIMSFGRHRIQRAHTVAKAVPGVCQSLCSDLIL